MPPSRKSLKSRPSIKEEEPDAMERFHEKKICSIIPTNPIKKKDIFVEYRPKSPRDCMNYNISQTDAKMDAGTTKIHLQQTRAEYEPYPEGYLFDEPPPPPPKKKKRPSHGRGPVWLFLDEEWKRKVDMEQEIYKKEMEARLKRKIKMLGLKTKQEHADMLKRVGPDWFQELSPNQITAVDELGAAIKKDLSKSTIINTQCCLAKLGLVLRPNHRHVAVALRYCCEDPVELILILYQLTSPNRKSYSLNDRLLLSSVAHLSMRSVLRELHIRIPSPPRAEKPHHKKERVKKPRINYKSPYVVPYTFEPEPPKHTGIYQNRHIQYPESPYFSYLKELKEEMAKCTLDETRRSVPCAENESLNGDESMMTILQREIDEELIAAQKKFNSLPHNRPPRKLLRPSIYKPCDKSTELFNNIRGFIHEQPEQYSRAVGGDISTSLEDSDEELYDYMAVIEEHEPKFIICGITLGRYGESIPIIGGIVADRVMDCKCTRKKRIVTSPDKRPNATNRTVSEKDGVCHCAEQAEEEEETKLFILVLLLNSSE
ncbi:hypothetical protein MML48_5g00010600 [Holotrichia oblita]|uniref:Uncharacterized protein n=1 Tax=Holotrichia oblita TaxID=644536 RepID=A0ACB9T414_HOLOL|nr:hypothetical protein MML48_5g00010600 [Holotrichia oblita]